MENSKQNTFILQGNLWKVMYQLSWPAVIGMVLYGLNVIFDAIFVGRFVGEAAFAGVSLAFPLTQIPLGIGQLIGGGAGAVVSISIGANDKFTQHKLLGNVNFLTITLSLVFMILGLLFTTSLIKMMGGSGQELQYGSDYLRVCLYGTVFWVAGLAGNLIVRAEGKMKTAAWMMGIGLLVNIVATYILIVVFGFGVEGAAIGTNIGMAVYTLTFIVYVLRRKISFNTQFFSFALDKIIIKNILSNGAPLFIMSAMMVLQGIVVMNALTTYGTTADVTFYGIVFRIMSFMMMPIIGLMRSLQPAIGINFGAGNYERVVQSFKIWSVSAALLILPFWLFLMLSPQTILSFILPERVLSHDDISNFRYFMGVLPILPMVFMGLTFFPAINKGKPAAILGLARQVVFYVPAMLLLPKFFGVNWVYIGSFAIDVIVAIWLSVLILLEFKHLRSGNVNNQTAGS